MTRTWAVLMMTASLATVACDSGVAQSVSSPTAAAQPASSATDNTQFAVGGIVQSVEKPNRAVGGAVIQITQGANAGKSAVSDDTGSFAILGVAPGPAKVQVSKGGFVTWTSKDFDLQNDTKLAVELFPTPATSSGGTVATGRCNDGSWTWATSRADACVNNGGLAYGVCPGPLCKTGI
ncbi:MAG TPA: carboxypeptidase-like regulatory domain-containing protein [Vicinamibacterales bacterium]